MDQLIKDKRALEAEVTILKNEKKELTKGKSDAEKKLSDNYDRL